MATTISIDIKAFSKEYEKKYEYLYTNHGEQNVPGYYETVDAGDRFIAAHPDFISEFCAYRGDILASDREIAAFAFTLQEMAPVSAVF